jgi:hypothetical protein
MNRLDLQNDLLPQLTFSSLKFFCRSIVRSMPMN